MLNVFSNSRFNIDLSSRSHLVMGCKLLKKRRLKGYGIPQTRTNKIILLIVLEIDESKFAPIG